MGTCAVVAVDESVLSEGFSSCLSLEQLVVKDTYGDSRVQGRVVLLALPI